MLSLYDANGLVHWTEREIRLRESAITHIAAEVAVALKAMNSAWDIRRVEAPLLTPRNLISDAYGPEDVFVQQRLSDHDHELVLRPETTPSTYVYMHHLLTSHAKVRLPLCVWQAGKSFRREQDQATKHIRLKEFWQMEFQCAFAADTANDYHSAVLEPVRCTLAAVTRLPTRIVPSDRLPSYSEVTMDVEVDNGDKWMEIASISRRTDFPATIPMTGKSGIRELTVKVLEIAIGLDRCIYNWSIADEREAV
ncbi:glycyl-tRNA synthetase [Mesorhizobium soli]|uniref:aminoacyl--tRNA ligase-related protein n=1 Tax=Pseudaminobacter soli (ex Li et al. 2025) TaxID=1295366 RepID=UPI002475C1B8|nr:aminoacyl--tRNA ligase-related protein [Mesorhizobium soli]MDH6232278.1 glycyl-tRNA synthetase [Mesorhizobium soli]